jgi:hypothetical protein
MNRKDYLMQDHKYWIDKFYSRFKIGDKVRHFKRQFITEEDDPNLYLYEIVGIGLNLDEKETLCVFYKPLYPNSFNMFSRNIEDFLAKVDTDKYPGSKQLHKYEKENQPI